MRPHTPTVRPVRRVTSPLWEHALRSRRVSRGNTSRRGASMPRVVHVEIPSKDADAAQSFYESLFGWQFSEPMEGMDYRMVDLGEQQGLAVYPDDSGEPGLKVYFGVDDIDGCISKIREIG